MTTSPKPPGRLGRLKTVPLLILLPLLLWCSARAGLASLRTRSAVSTGDIAQADAAVSLSAGDPAAHLVRGAVLEADGVLSPAIEEYRESIALRSEDYSLWLNLARASELNGDMPGALAAARAAVPLAPFYAQPHWQLGNILVRAGQRDEGFKELRLAGASDVTLLPGIIDLAWNLSGGDVQYVKRLIQPESAQSFAALATYFGKRGEISEAIEMFRRAGASGHAERRQYLSELIASQRFADAHALWAIEHPDAGDGVGTIVDPGFEQEHALDEPGFGWRGENKAPTISLALDDTQPREGKSSLRVEFKGDSEPVAPVISQLVVLAPNARYQLKFSVRTEGLVSGGPPILRVIDAGSNVLLGSSQLAHATNGWQDLTIDFAVNEQVTAIQIALAREPCNTSPCPVFGRLWLDGFLLRRL